jgi:prevent-host-death family protein
MTKTADVSEVAAHFTDWLRQVAEGHEVVITERSQPLAKLVAVEPGAGTNAMSSPAQRAEAVAAWIRANGLPGRWIGEVPFDTAIIAEEMFDRK